MIDYIGLSTSNLNQSNDFYEKALAPLSYIKAITYEDGAGFSYNDKIIFWIGRGDTYTSNIHIAFTAKSSESVDEFYKISIATEGLDNGSPGVRTI